MVRGYLMAVTDINDERHIVKTYSSGMINNHGLKGRAKKSAETADKVKKHNQKVSIQNLCWLMQLNFEEGDYNLSLHYCANGDRPLDEWQAQKNVAAFCKDLKKWCKQNMPDGYSLDYLYCTHTTTARGAIHHHMILRKDIPLYVIQQLWSKWGSVSVGRSLYKGYDYYTLAWYWIADPKHEPHPKGMRSYIPSHGLKRPVTVREIVPAKTWRINPKAPKGWLIKEDTLYNGVDVYGYPYQSYTMIKISDVKRI